MFKFKRPKFDSRKKVINYHSEFYAKENEKFSYHVKGTRYQNMYEKDFTVSFSTELTNLRFYNIHDRSTNEGNLTVKSYSLIQKNK